MSWLACFEPKKTASASDEKRIDRQERARKNAKKKAAKKSKKRNRR